MAAAEIINRRHGWTQAQSIRDEREDMIAANCDSILRNMKEYTHSEYFNELRKKGYKVKPRYDNKGKLVGYTVSKGASVFKASQIGRPYMASKLYATWKKYHPTPVQVKRTSSAPSISPFIRPARPAAQTSATGLSKVAQRYQQLQAEMKPQKPATSVFDISTGKDTKQVTIPNDIKDIFTDNIQVPEDNEEATVKDITNIAMLLFAGYLDAATSMSESHGGGGSAPESGWGRKDDEDDRKFAHRCVQMAHSMCKPKQRSRGFHR